ncbi:hypothetical protein JL739_12870 [Listeria welshimeri]|uniref:hypothetical protein n=1 Tax=Listeria welshimeri TaxID=1643 RepID=UPI0010B3029D|nr:hypothetical protein [Listeria welshimeri]MBC1705447.1 hypothetical protein [Listeria welshimeri]MBC2333479.1 hypothetical protein [Listeria welshimeri]MBF2485323.1 hypothetical protein [Listeria welshimeri]MBS9361998.1 hypothetical protein [Listeria welshimeri]
MLTNNKMENTKNVIKLVEEYFSSSVSSFQVETEEDAQEFFIDCLIYRSYWIQLSLTDVEKGGVFNIDVSIGKNTALYSLIENGEDLSIYFDKDSVYKNLTILDNYLKWRMTDEQKRTFNIL